MKTATLLCILDGFSGHAALYKLNPPLEGHEFVVVSSTMSSFFESETYIFPASRSGDVIEWMELPGSYRGGRSHEQALVDAGYSVTNFF